MVLYELSSDEQNQLDNVWDFINKFKKGSYTLHEYRIKVIKDIKMNYTIDKFDLYERICEKLLWNLRHKLDSEKLYKCHKSKWSIGDLDDLIQKMNDEQMYRSFINKIITIDDTTGDVYYKPMEGSSDIFVKNGITKINRLTDKIFRDRDLYENYMNNCSSILPIMEKIEKEDEYYYEFDYAFPNLNYNAPLLGSNEYRKLKIYKMYYDINAEKNWFRLIKP